MKRLITAIIVNWNGKEDTLNCLASLRKVRVPAGCSFLPVVVDNGSSDDSVSVIRKKYPETFIVETGENLGFTGGNNRGIETAIQKGAFYIWLINNDTIVDANVLSAISVLDNPGIGAVGSKIYFAPDHEYHHDRYAKNEHGKVFWYAGGCIDWANMYASHRGVDEVDHGQYNNITDTDFVTGCSFFVRADTLGTVGRLDDAFYLYYEDLDLSMRIKKSGFRIVYDPSSIVWHVNAGSSGKPGNPLQRYYQTRNRMIVGMRYAPFRTKVALVREALLLITRSGIERKAILDWAFHRWNKQYVPKNKNN